LRRIARFAARMAGMLRFARTGESHGLLELLQLLHGN
jgi:hypothetical protein